MKNFADYSKFYDTFYKDKDYKKESEFVLKLINEFSKESPKSLLSLGCGTCSYELIMAKQGISITGIDLSQEMLDIAKYKIEKAKLNNKIEILQSDIRNFDLGKKYDTAMAMFNIIGYQTQNEDMEKTLGNVHRDLKKNGIFVFDCWYMPAVLKDKPTDRIKVIESDGHKFIRMTKSNLNLHKNLIEINFTAMEIENNLIISETNETHLMRYWSLPELTYFLNKTGFDLVKSCNFMDESSNTSEDNWNIFVVAQKI